MMIFPFEKKWNFHLLSVFLNELNEFIKSDHSFRTKNSNKGKVIKFHFISSLNANFHVFITITSEDITVKVSTLFLFRRCKIDILRSIEKPNINTKKKKNS